MVSELLSIPASTFSFFVAPYLDSSDFISLRITSKKQYELIHSDAADEVWKQALIRDFCFQEDTKNDDSNVNNNDDTFTKTDNASILKGSHHNFLETLRWVDPKNRSVGKSKEKPISVFGSSMSDSIIIATSFYESWKQWKKASNYYFHISNDKKDELSYNNLPQRNIHGPYFLRAAKMWTRIVNWCNDPESGSVGDGIKSTLRPGIRWQDTVLSSARPNMISQTSLNSHSYEAIFAFCGGQETPPHEGGNLYGLFGGYGAYNAKTCTYLHDASRVCGLTRNSAVPIATTDGSNHACKDFTFNPYDGQIYLCLPGSVLPACQGLTKKNNNLRKRLDDLLIWFEQYSNLLCNRYIGLGMIWEEERDDAIVHYPTLRANETVRYSNGVQLTSRAVTRGVEVVASGILAIELNAFIYSFRIRLLNKDDEDYESTTERGFETCQLKSRHWKIHDYTSGKIDSVDGEGVIGYYPLLSESYYRNDNQSSDGRTICVGEKTAGIFQYQSCSLPVKQGHFEGHLLFVPGSINKPTGEPFRVKVAPFALDQSPEFFY
jgi:uncharacterized protein affecting Mg2+/Co2+ transport